MITRRTFTRVQKKLRKKQNVLRIVSETGVSLELVSAIADGWTPRFPKPGRPRMKPLTEPEDTPFFPHDQRKDADGAYLQNPDERPQRCPECGRLVYMPCLECKLRGQAFSASRFRVHRGDDAMLALDLRPEWRERYEKIREEKVLRREQELDRRMEEVM